jgi:hypothetical protein
MAPSGSKPRIYALHFSHLGGAVAGALFVLILIGCMNFAIGNRTIEDGNGVLVQEGDVHLTKDGEEDVYYPIPYASVPNLEVNDSFAHFKIIEQKEDHFRIRNTSFIAEDVHWHARGVRIGLLPPPGPGPILSSSPPQGLPSQPIPAQ